jgi:hypothetical protein
VLTTPERHDRHLRSCKDEVRRVSTHRSDQGVVNALDPFKEGSTNDLG